MLLFVKPTNGFSRGTDDYGSGQFHSSRDGGTRLHRGLDLIARPGEFIKSPITGTVTREAMPYKDDPRFKGLVIRGNKDFEGLEVKLFYVVPTKFGAVSQGDIIGTAQDLSIKYKSITNHVHMEVRRNGIIVSPTEFFNYCF